MDLPRAGQEYACPTQVLSRLNLDRSKATCGLGRSDYGLRC
jgi:hypothetical protein